MKIFKIVLAISVLISFSSKSFSQNFSFIPQPISVTAVQGEFPFSLSMKIISDKEQNENADYLNHYLAKYYKVRPMMDERIKKYIALRNPGIQTDNTIHHVGEYTLSVTTDSIVITGSDAGVFNGIQTFLQLLPAESQMQFGVRCVEVFDYPRFSWRGMHLDCARHFFSVEFVKKYIDMMAYYKFNTFHWHLTDDQGWRIEIKQYPKLTEIGSTRKETMVAKNFDPYIGDKTAHSGFYTQEQIKEIVNYATKRHITIVPEIEMPGHSAAAIAAYPELACFGNNFEVWTMWGVTEVALCPTDEVILFYENVLSEVISLFPGQYIHVGGDEVPDAHWKKSKQVTELMMKEGLKTYPEVEAYFINRIETYLTAHGKKMIGWDEILEGGVSNSAAIMSWRGTDGGIAAAKHSNYTVMTPGDYCYFDHCQSKSVEEPLCIGGVLPLQKVYEYEPIPVNLKPEEQKFILGAQANVWTEYITTNAQVEYMIFPRMLALSEVLWSQPKDKIWYEFAGRINQHFQLLDFRGINYRQPEPEIQLRSISENAYNLGISCLNLNSDIYYTVDGSKPTSSSNLYTEPKQISIVPGQKLKAISISRSGKKSVVAVSQ